MKKQIDSLDCHVDNKVPCDGDCGCDGNCGENCCRIKGEDVRKKKE